jgi:hypothetical protein
MARKRVVGTMANLIIMVLAVELARDAFRLQKGK